jgi:hypothetical protein
MQAGRRREVGDLLGLARSTLISASAALGLDRPHVLRAAALLLLPLADESHGPYLRSPMRGAPHGRQQAEDQFRQAMSR